MKTALFLDVDGVILRGSQPIEGSIEFIDYLKGVGVPFLLLTNNSSRAPETLANKFLKFGLKVEPCQIYTSGLATVEYISSSPSLRGKKAFVIGSRDLSELLRGTTEVLDTDRLEDHVKIEVVIVGLDRDLNYKKLTIACLALRKGAEFIGTNSDVTFPSKYGQIPGAGATLAYLQACSGREPIVIGKPSQLIGKLAIRHLLRIYPELEDRLEELWIIGDRLETDVKLAHNLRSNLSSEFRNLRVRSFLTLTGITSQEDLARGKIVPDIVLQKLSDLKGYIESIAIG